MVSQAGYASAEIWWGQAVDSNNSLKRRRRETVHTECSLHSFLTRDITVGNFEAYRCASFSSGGRLGRNKLNSVASLFKMGADDARSRDVTSFGGDSVDSSARNASSVDAQKNENLIFTLGWRIEVATKRSNALTLRKRQLWLQSDNMSVKRTPTRTPKQFWLAIYIRAVDILIFVRKFWLRGRPQQRNFECCKIRKGAFRQLTYGRTQGRI